MLCTPAFGPLVNPVCTQEHILELLAHIYILLHEGEIETLCGHGADLDVIRVAIILTLTRGKRWVNSRGRRDEACLRSPASGRMTTAITLTHVSRSVVDLDVTHKDAIAVIRSIDLIVDRLFEAVSMMVDRLWMASASWSRRRETHLEHIPSLSADRKTSRVDSEDASLVQAVMVGMKIRFEVKLSCNMS